MATDLNKFIPICQLTPNMKNINITFIVLDVGAPRRTPQGNDVRTVRVADPTGSVMMTVWNDIGNCIAESDIWRLRNGYTSVYKGVMSLSCGKLGEMVKTGEFFMAFSEIPNMSEYNTDWAVKYPITRKGSPDEEAGGSAPGSNSGRGFPAEAGPTAQTQLQRPQQFSSQRGGGLKRAGGPPHLGDHRGRPVAVNVPRKISRV